MYPCQDAVGGASIRCALGAAKPLAAMPISGPAVRPEPRRAAGAAPQVVSQCIFHPPESRPPPWPALAAGAGIANRRNREKP